MGLKDVNTTSDFIDFDKASVIGQKLLKTEKNRIIGLYIIISINTGLRISDLLSLKYEDFKDETLKLNERKTNKKREIKINATIKEALIHMGKANEGFIFRSQKGVVYRLQSINVILKKVFEKEAKKLNISSHSLRKTFGRKVWEANGESEKALTYLSELLNHNSPAITRKYLGIRQQELNNIYDCLV